MTVGLTTYTCRSFMSTFAVWALLCLLNLTLCDSARARERCAEDLEKQPRTVTTRYGRPLTDLARISVRGEVFELPIGFLSSWPSTQYEECEMFICESEGSSTSDKYVLPFTFWMPTRRFVETDEIHDIRVPCETGRSLPDTNEYIVKASVLWPFIPGATSKFEKFLVPPLHEKLARKEHSEFWEIEYIDDLGLTKYYQNKGAYDLKLPRYYGDDGDLVVDAHCALHLQRMCITYFMKRSDNVVWRVLFPVERIGEWKEIADVSLHFASTWREAGDVSKRVLQQQPFVAREKRQGRPPALMRRKPRARMRPPGA